MEASKLKKGSGEPNSKKVGSVSWDQVKAIAEDKMQDLNAFSTESAMKMVAGTARSMGITVKGNAPFNKTKLTWQKYQKAKKKQEVKWMSLELILLLTLLLY